MKTQSIHLLVELHGCNSRLLNDEQHLVANMLHAVDVAGARSLGCVSHRFAPQGVSVLIAIEESHFSLHTWPECGYAAADFYTCGNCESGLAVDVIRQALQATECQIVRVQRGHIDRDVSLYVETPNSSRP
jgi:S-adenosylmethionine decarboxylase